MRPTQHPSNNGVLGAPEGWDQKQMPCSALAITRTDWDGIPAVVSFWKPTPEELAVLNAGGSVALWIAGQTMPPAGLSVDEG